MQIVTESIRSFLIDTFQKSFDELLISDLLLVESLTIDGKDFNGGKLAIYFQDLKNFKNLKYLEVVNSYINSSVVNILAGIPYLENVIFRNCAFSKKIKNMGKLSQVKSLRMVDCNVFDLDFLSELTSIKKIYLSGMKLDDFHYFKNLNLDFLDISCSSLKSSLGISYLKVKNLIVSNSLYESYKEEFNSLNAKVIVMADYREGYYIERWIN